MWECRILHKSFQSVPAAIPKKEQDKDDEDDKKDRDGFQQHQNAVNVIFGGDPSFSKRAQKLLLREILSVEPAIQRPLKYSEVPITFSREDQWTSFSEPGKFPLVLDPVVQGSKLTRVLIDGGSGLNLIFASTLVKMGLNYMSLLTPSKAPFYGIVPGNSSNWLGYPPSHIWYGAKLSDRVYQVQSSRLRIFLPCHLGKTSTGQIHGRASLHLFTPQDVGQHMSPFSTRGPPQVL